MLVSNIYAVFGKTKGTKEKKKKNKTKDKEPRELLT